jgi:hypothetical protein
MTWFAAWELAGAFTVLWFGGALAYAAGAVTFIEARRGYLGGDWHRRAFRRAYGWFALCAAFWLAVVLLWLAVRA